MGGEMQIQVDRFVATAQAAQPPRVAAEHARPDTARAFMEWMVSEGYDPAHLDAMTPLELERMFTEGPDEFDADEAQVQAQLVVLGYAPGPIDGWYGPRTSEAVAQFQLDHGIEPADGTMTPETLEALQQEAGQAQGDVPAEGAAGSTEGGSVAEAVGVADAAVANAVDAQANLDRVLEGDEADGAYAEDEEAVDSAGRRNQNAERLLDDALGDEIDARVAETGESPEEAAASIRARYADDPATLAEVDASLERLGYPAEEPELGTSEATSARIDAVVASDPTGTVRSIEAQEDVLNAETDEAVLAEYQALVDSGDYTPEQARELMTERYSGEERDVIEASFNRLERTGEVEPLPDTAGTGSGSGGGGGSHPLYM